jgi:cytochrome c oxidase subunit 1
VQICQLHRACFSALDASSFVRSTTVHGLGMVFLFIMPGVISALGNFVVPQSFCLLDFATPRLNNMAFWVSILAVEVLFLALSSDAGIAAG